MQLLQDGVIAALAAVGLATIVWFTVTALTHPRERVRSETAVIVPARGAAETLEHTVRTLESERYASGGFRASSSRTAAWTRTRSAWRSCCAARASM